MACLLAEPQTGHARPPAPPAPADTTSSAENLLLVEVSINGEPRDGEYLVARNGDRFLVRPADLATWRIRRPSAPPTLIDGDAFVPLAALPGVTAVFDPATQRLALTVPPRAVRGRRRFRRALAHRADRQRIRRLPQLRCGDAVRSCAERNRLSGGRRLG